MIPYGRITVLPLGEKIKKRLRRSDTEDATDNEEKTIRLKCHHAETNTDLPWTWSWPLRTITETSTTHSRELVILTGPQCLFVDVRMSIPKKIFEY